MRTPSGFASVTHVSAHADEAQLRAIFRVFLLASVLMVTALVPLFVALNAASSEADTGEVRTAPTATMLSWAAKDDAEKQTYVIDGYTLTLSTHVHSNGERVAFLRVRAPTGESTSIHGEIGFPVPSAGFGVGKLDAQSLTQQIIFTSYTGGLHCCTQITVLQLFEGKWREINLGQWDGDPLAKFPSDVDRDGAADFVLKDDRFDYAFAPYTEGHKPPRIFNIEGAKVVEVGAQSRYNTVYEADMNNAQAGCLKHKNASCAAFVANASRLGRHDWAWTIMLANYQKSTDWNFPTKCKVPLAAGVCPPGRSEQFREFPEALGWFLTDTGYTRP
jgi:hypothetical protein